MGETKGLAVVTGGSRGIGRAIALQLAQDGYDIAFCYRQCEEAAQAVESEINAMGRRVYRAACDVSNLDAVKTFLRNCEDALGPLQVLVNCAGIARDNPLVLMDPAAWHDVLNTNLTGTFNFCRTAVFGFMKRKQGVIINVSSVSGVYGNATQGNYSATKAGVIGLSKAIAKELAPYNIRVNVVAPGYIETDMTAQLDEQAKERALKAIPMRRIGEPEDVAHLVSFLISNRAKYITAQVIQVDGGIVI